MHGMFVIHTAAMRWTNEHITRQCPDKVLVPCKLLKKLVLRLKSGIRAFQTTPYKVYGKVTNVFLAIIPSSTYQCLNNIVYRDIIQFFFIVSIENSIIAMFLIFLVQLLTICFGRTCTHSLNNKDLSFGPSYKQIRQKHSG